MERFTEDLDILTTLKIVLVGERSVGKSSILKRFCEDVFDDCHLTTVGVSVKEKTITVDKKNVNLEIFDTAGEERFRSLTPVFYRGTQGAIIVYDVTDRRTYLKLESWLEELAIFETKSDVVKILIGNKIDKAKHQVSTEEGQKLAQKYGILFIETSARSSNGIHKAFEMVVRKIIRTPGLWEKTTSENINLKGISESSSKSWCSGWCNYNEQ